MILWCGSVLLFEHELLCVSIQDALGCKTLDESTTALSHGDSITSCQRALVSLEVHHLDRKQDVLLELAVDNSIHGGDEASPNEKPRAKPGNWFDHLDNLFHGYYY